MSILNSDKRHEAIQRFKRTHDGDEPSADGMIDFLIDEVEVYRAKLKNYDELLNRVHDLEETRDTLVAVIKVLARGVMKINNHTEEKLTKSPMPDIKPPKPDYPKYDFVVIKMLNGEEYDLHDYCFWAFGDEIYLEKENKRLETGENIKDIVENNLNKRGEELVLKENNLNQRGEQLDLKLGELKLKMQRLKLRL